MRHHRLRFLPLSTFGLILTAGIVGGVLAQEEKKVEAGKKVSVNFRDIHRDGKVAVVGHFGIPIGQKVTVEGTRAKASKQSNKMTLHVTKVDGKAPNNGGQSTWIQIQNVDSLPEGEAIVVEGYEFLSWRGDPDRNWLVEVNLLITKVVAPDGLKVNARQP